MAASHSALRRTAFIAVLAALVAAALSWRRRRSEMPTPAAPPEWPPLRAVPQQEIAQEIAAEITAEITAEIVEDVADAGWVSPLADGSAPASHPLKAKDGSRIFHEPGGRFYDRTRPDRCYATAAAAEADGYRRSKS